MMNITRVAIGDIHGKDVWQEILKLDLTTIEKIVFIGDYVDSFNKSVGQQTEQLKKIIQLKKDNIDKVILLKGNHDIQYFYPDDMRYRCSGFKEFAVPIFNSIFMENKNLFQYAYQQNDILFTHAGLSQGFYQFLIKESRFFKDLVEEYSISESLNMIGDSSEEHLLSTVGFLRGGNATFGGITWADKSELCYFKPFSDGITKQVIGHTWSPTIMKTISHGCELNFIDNLTDESTINDFLIY